MKNIIRVLTITTAFLMLGICLLFIKGILKEVTYTPNLTREQKLEDFEQFYTVVTEAMPYIENVKETYGIDFVARKDYYIEMIENTESNAEFYAAMQAISRDLCSFHTDICYPLYSNIASLGCYNSEVIPKLRGMEDTQNQWYEHIGNEIKESNVNDYIYVVYFDGEYVVTASNVEGVRAGDRLKQVNDRSVDDYVVNTPSIGKIRYDGKREKPYRTQYYFNSTSGDAAKTVWVNEQGEEYTMDLYHSLMGEMYMGYGYLYEKSVSGEKVVTEPSSPLYSYRDDENQIEYIKISNFDNNQGNEIKKMIADMEYDTVIIDLRGNYGGHPSYFLWFVYPNLYSETISGEYYWKTNKSIYNLVMMKKLSVYIQKDSETWDSIIYRKRYNWVGKYQGDEREVYYLVDDNTGSAADAAATIVKANNLGTVVGENTAGEGLGTSYFCDTLDHSGLVFIYYSTVRCDETGADLYTPGTEPDVYIAASYEDYVKKLQCADNTYPGLVQYDPLVKWVIENKE